MTTLDLVSTLDEIRQTWSPKAKAKALELIKRQIAHKPQVWYCDFERDDDGKPVLVDELVVERVIIGDDDVFVHRYLVHEEGCDCGDRDHPGAGIGRVRHGSIPKYGANCDGHPHGIYDYEHARSDQWPPSLRRQWSVWLAMSGRGAGKTKSGAEWVLKMAEMTPTVAMIGRRRKDVVDVMVEGRSGLEMACARAGLSYEWLPSKLEFTLPNGAIIRGFSAEEPDSLRGPEHGAAWLDEPAHMPLINDVWDMLGAGLRVPGIPGGARIYCTSTPLPTKWLKALIAEKDTITVVVPTYVNLRNLDPAFKKRLIDKWEGTRKGRQELEGELLEDVEGALWEAEWIDAHRLKAGEMFDPETDRHYLEKVAIAIDPAGTANRRSDETGIIVLGLRDGLVIVLADHSGKYSPAGWADKALDLAEEWQANDIVAEKNFGGDMVQQTLRSAAERRKVDPPKVHVRHAHRSKQVRAEPVAALYEQGYNLKRPKVVHNGKLSKLEEEMLTWVPGVGDSPNRVDALVWGAEFIRGRTGKASIASPRGTLTPSNNPRNAPPTRRTLRPTISRLGITGPRIYTGR
jgi:phage terminase large subunit-like protein